MKINTKDRNFLLGVGYSEHDLFWIERLPEILKSYGLEEECELDFNRRSACLQLTITRLKDSASVSLFAEYPVNPANQERFDVEVKTLLDAFRG